MANKQIKDIANNSLIGPGYNALLKDLKARIYRAQIKASLAVNAELMRVYWEIGKAILTQEKEQGWGAKVVDKLAKDLKEAFPDMKGFSPRNLRYMKAFAEYWPDEPILQQPATKLPWSHNCVLLDRIKESCERTWYAEQTIQNGWSCAILELQIENGLYKRQGTANVNFDRTLPAPQSDLARQILKDPYNFDFLALDVRAHERELEKGLLDHIRSFLLELGVGFAFVCSQHHLNVGGEDFYVDMLLYHLRLRCYVVIELKTVPFKPEFAGKMNFYLSAVDDLLRHPDDKPSIGIVICKSKNRVVAEYSLRDTSKPIGVSILPESLQGNLPSIEQLESELEGLPLEDAVGAQDMPSK